MLIRMPPSMTATRMNGIEIERNTSKIMTKMMPIETELTMMISRLVVVIRSYVAGASPTSREFGS